MKIKVLIKKQKNNVNSIDFVVYDQEGKEYMVSNCHRTDNPFWKNRNCKCFHGNIDDGKIVNTGVLRMYPTGEGVIIIND